MTQLLGVGVRPGWPVLGGGVVEHLAQHVAEQLRPGPGAGDAEQVEREDDGGGHWSLALGP